MVCWYPKFLEDYEPIKTKMANGRIARSTIQYKSLLLYIAFPKIGISFQTMSGTHP